MLRFSQQNHLLPKSQQRKLLRIAALPMKIAILPLLGLLLTAPFAATAGEPDYYASFNPDKGFTPAKRDLTEIYLQLAGSLEYYGSPVEFLRHVKSEHDRIAAEYRQKLGKPLQYGCPAYMTDDYLDHLAATWGTLSPKLGLAPLARDIGNNLRNAVLGTRDHGTIVVGILNDHQAKVFDAVAGKGSAPVGFDDLNPILVKRLQLDKTTIESGSTYAQRDAVGFASFIHGDVLSLYKKLDAGLSPEDATRVKAALAGIYMDVGRMADAELEDGLAEWALGSRTASK
ncbi:MAG: hypothetical protein QM796_20340 [Chthoniobacteraceae bacterium]